MEGSADCQSRGADRDHKIGERVVMSDSARVEYVLLARANQKFLSRIRAARREDCAHGARRGRHRKRDQPANDFGMSIAQCIRRSDRAMHEF
jgi:hypothetical protein